LGNGHCLGHDIGWSVANAHCVPYAQLPVPQGGFGYSPGIDKTQ